MKYQVFYGTLLYSYGIARQRKLLKNADRSQSHTYTCFYRSPGQLEALIGPVMDFLNAGRKPGKLQINVFAGSEGAESYTFASVLMHKFPGLDFHISGSDLHQSTVDISNKAVYSSEDVHRGLITKEFIAQTFDKVGDKYQVKPEIRKHVSFKTANLLDPKLIEQFEPADIVLAQNVFFHLNQDMAREAFRNIVRFLKPKSVLFIDGMELDMREELTVEAGVEPLEFKTKAIHDFATKLIGDKWWTYYYGMAPYASWHPNRLRRYSTIFFKGK